MSTNYKIYYDDSYVLISDDRAQMNENFAKVVSGDNDVGAFLHNPVFYTDEAKKEETVLIFSEKPDWVMDMLRKKVKVIIAGGGTLLCLMKMTNYCSSTARANGTCRREKWMRAKKLSAPPNARWRRKPV